MPKDHDINSCGINKPTDLEFSQGKKLFLYKSVGCDGNIFTICDNNRKTILHIDSKGLHIFSDFYGGDVTLIDYETREGEYAGKYIEHNFKMKWLPKGHKCVELVRALDDEEPFIENCGYGIGFTRKDSNGKTIKYSKIYYCPFCGVKID